MVTEPSQLWLQSQVFALKLWLQYQPMSGIKHSWFGHGKITAHPRQAWCSEQPGGRTGTDLPVMALSPIFRSTSLARRHFQPLTPGSTESVRGSSSLRNSQAQFPMRRQRPGLKKPPGAEKGHSSLQRQWDPSLPSLFPSDAGALTPCGQGAQKLALALSQS